MYKPIKTFRNPRIAAIIVAILLCGSFFFVVGRQTVACDEGSAAVAYARQLPKARLAKLYTQMEQLVEHSSEQQLDLYADTFGRLPEPFNDLDAVKIRPETAGIMLEGCFDTFVFLHFEGIGRINNGSQRQIILSWGEHEGAGSEVLWQDSPAHAN